MSAIFYNTVLASGFHKTKCRRLHLRQSGPGCRVERDGAAGMELVQGGSVCRETSSWPWGFLRRTGKRKELVWPLLNLEVLMGFPHLCLAFLRLFAVEFLKGSDQVAIATSVLQTTRLVPA